MFKSANNQISDTELFHRIQKGDEKAFTIAYELYNKLIYVLSYRYLMDEERAKDVEKYLFQYLRENRAE